MQAITVVILLFAFFALSRAALRVRDKHISWREFLFWLVIWIGVIFIAFFPRVTSYFSTIFGVGRGVDFLIYLSIILLFYLVFRIYVMLDNIRQQMTKLVRSTSLEHPKRKKK